MATAEQKILDELEITCLGNPAKPRGEYGRQMLERMNQSHLALAKWAFDLLDFQKTDDVLDMGCGGGAGLKLLSAFVTEGKLYGADYSPVSVEKTMETNHDLVEQGRLSVIRASVEALPFPDHSFDKIVTVESFYFWPDHVNNLKALRRVLKPGGIMAVINDIYDTEILSEEERANIARFDLFNPTLKEYEDLFRAAGYQHITVNTKADMPWICICGQK